MLISITPLSGAQTEIAAPPDIIWTGIVGDFAPDALRGLKSSSPLETAIILALFTDAPADAGELRYEHRGDFRGWPGDGIDGEPMGSKLWLFRRRELTDATALEIKAEILRALTPLVDQQVATKVTVEPTVNKSMGRVEAQITVYGRDGAAVYSNRFDLIWRGR